MRGGFAPSPKSPPPQARNTSPYGGGLKKSQREAKPLLKNLLPLSLLRKELQTESQREAKSQNREFERDEVPLQKKSSPSPCQGEGDTGDGVPK